MFLSHTFCIFAEQLIIIRKLKIFNGMKRRNNNSQTLCVEELVKHYPILTEEEMKDFYSYEEAVQECMHMFDEGVVKINQKYAIRTNQ